MPNLIIFETDEDGEEVEVIVPHKWIICRCCEGEGKSSAYLGAYTESDMEEAGPDFRDDYMAGVYDRLCDTCGGTGKVKVPDFSRMPKDQVEAWQRQAEDEWEINAIHAAEMRAGA